MKQRLGIAAAIMEKPDILVLDEPTNALDDSGVKLVHDIILSEKKRGAAVIISCHDFSLLRSVADVVYCLDNGKLTAQYTAKELSEKLKQEESI
ncbi:ATP-binding cassette domain-containing protein, partial [Hominenteromicrobium sp.]